jgi:hypothetical protein
MCFMSTPKAEPAPPPAAPPSAAPVLTNMYDPSNPESGMAAEKGSAMNKAKGTSQLQVNLDPTMANSDKGTGLQITK